MIFNIVGVSLFFQSRHGGGGGGGERGDDEDHMILSGVFLDTVADTLASLVVLVSSLGMQAWAFVYPKNRLDDSLHGLINYIDTKAKCRHLRNVKRSSLSGILVVPYFVQWL
jgi:Co/Zn/Cd efflux system component